MGSSSFEAPAEVAPGGRTDLRQGGSRDEGQDEQEDGRHGEAEAYGDGLGDLVAVGLGLWSRRIGHYGERYTPVLGACRDDADPVVVGPLLRSPEGSEGHQSRAIAGCVGRHPVPSVYRARSA